MLEVGREAYRKWLKERYCVVSLAGLLGKGFSDFNGGLFGGFTGKISEPRKRPLDILLCLCSNKGTSLLCRETN
jgi:hypothetical protein